MGSNSEMKLRLLLETSNGWKLSYHLNSRPIWINDLKGT